MAQEKICGIYCIENKDNGKKYIGLSKNIHKRWIDHKSKLNNNKHDNVHLQYAWNFYGESKFKFYIIEVCDEENLRNREIYYIKKYKTQDQEYGYNMTVGGDGGNTLIGYSEKELVEHSKKLSRILKGVINQGANNPMAKKVICLNNMKIFDTTAEAAKWANVPDTAIQGCCNKRKHYLSAGFDKDTGERLLWEYYDENKTYVYNPYKREYPTKRVLCHNNNTIYNSAKEADAALNISHFYITKCCNGYLKSAKGYKFSYV